MENGGEAPRISPSVKELLGWGGGGGREKDSINFQRHLESNKNSKERSA